MINSDGTLGELVDIHHEMDMQHTNARLLPWHRVFLHLFEEALHNYHPDVCVPYWDWTRPEERSGCTTPTSIASGGSGTTARKEIIRIHPSPTWMR